MPNWYTSLDALKLELNITDATDDRVLGRLIERASRFVDRHCRRVAHPNPGFLPTTRTVVLDGTATRTLRLSEDLLALSAASVRQSTVSTPATAFVLTPNPVAPDLFLNPSDVGPPYYEVVISDFIAQIWWAGHQTCTLTGDWGYGNDTADTGVTIPSGGITAGATAIALGAGQGASFEAGWTLLVGSERLFLSGIAGDTLIVQRGMNGSIGASHAAGIAMLRYVVPPDLEEAVAMQAARWHARRKTGYGDTLASAELGSLIATKQLDPDVQKALDPYRRRRFGATTDVLAPRLWANAL